MMKTKDGIVCRRVEDRAQGGLHLGSATGPDPDRNRDQPTRAITPATTWVRVCSDSSHMPTSQPPAKPIAAKIASPTPLTLQHSQAVKNTSTGQATVYDQEVPDRDQQPGNDEVVDEGG